MFYSFDKLFCSFDSFLITIKKKKILFFFINIFLYKYFLHNIRYGFTKSKKIIKKRFNDDYRYERSKSKKTSKKDELFKEKVKKTYNESPFKSIILDVRSILPKKGCKKIEKGLEYVEEMKELTFLQIGNGKNNLIKLKNDLIERFKKNNRRKKSDRDYYEYEENN